MKLLKSKMWHWYDIGLLKWSALLAGMAFGAYFHQYVGRYGWVLIVSALLLALRPAAAYWKDDD